MALTRRRSCRVCGRRRTLDIAGLCVDCAGLSGEAPVFEAVQVSEMDEASAPPVMPAKLGQLMGVLYGPPSPAMTANFYGSAAWPEPSDDDWPAYSTSVHVPALSTKDTRVPGGLQAADVAALLARLGVDQASVRVLRTTESVGGGTDLAIMVMVTWEGGTEAFELQSTPYARAADYLAALEAEWLRRHPPAAKGPEGRRAIRIEGEE